MSPKCGVYVPTATRRRLVAVIGVMAVAMGADGCPGGNGGPMAGRGPSAPTAFTGTIKGNVSVDGVPQAGSTLAADDQTSGNNANQSTGTDASGNYSFPMVGGGGWNIELKTLPPDVEWQETVVNRGIDFDGEVEVVDFVGRRKLEGIFDGKIAFSGGDSRHDPFVFDAPFPADAGLVITRTADDKMEISGPGLGPTPLPLTMGTFDPVTGQFDATTTGTIAGFPGIQVTITGTITGAVGDFKRAQLTITLGGGGGLPNGTSISYFFDGTL